MLRLLNKKASIKKKTGQPAKDCKASSWLAGFSIGKRCMIQA
jgi:hypothetical protein